jgi:hypothetical protein
MNSARLDSMEYAQSKGLPLVKVWVSAVDSKTRDSHAAIDGEQKPLDEPFSNGLMYPGDPASGADEVINCRCGMVTQIEGLSDIKQDMRMINKEVVPYKTYEEWLKNRVEKSEGGAGSKQNLLEIQKLAKVQQLKQK